MATKLIESSDSLLVEVEADKEAVQQISASASCSLIPTYYINIALYSE